jgi:hypothetical protein
MTMTVDNQYHKLSTLSRQWVDRLPPTAGRHGGTKMGTAVIGEDRKQPGAAALG